MLIAGLTAALGAAVVALIIPGWMVAWGLGIQGALRLVTTPALSLGVWAAVTWIAIGLHLPWRVWLVSPLMGLVLLPFVLGRLLTLRPGAKARWPQVPQTRLTRGWWLVGWICVFISGLPYLVATRAGGRVAQTWDVVFHLSAIRYTRERASASPWVAFAPLYNGEEIYYPNIFHNIVSLLPGSPVTVYTAITLVFLGLWPLMIGVFTLLTVVSLRGSTPDSYFMSGLAMLGAAMGINFPTLAVANYATPPYNLSLVATPGVIILGLMIYRLRPQPGLGLGAGASCGGKSGGASLCDSSRADASSRDSRDSRAIGHIPPSIEYLKSTWHRWHQVLSQALYSSQLFAWLGLGFFVAVCGLACTHPSAMFNLLLLLGIPFVAWLGWLLVKWRRARRTKILVGGGFAMLVFGMFAVVLLPRLIGMTKFANHRNNLVANALWMFADWPSGWARPDFGITGIIITVAALGASVSLWRARRLGWLVWGFLISWVFYLLAAGPVWPGYFLAAPWYLQASRLASLVLMYSLPLAAYGFMRCLQSLEAFCLTRNLDVSMKSLQLALVGVLLVASSGATLWGRQSVIARSYDPQEIVRGTMLTAAEQDFIRHQAPHLPPQAVIWGAPQEGTAYWWILEGKRVVFPSLSWPRGDALRVMRDLNDGTLSAVSCRYLKQLGVTHYYVDTDRSAAGSRFGAYRWLWHENDVTFRLPESILTKVAEHPSGSINGSEFSGQRLYRVDLQTCSGQYSGV
ncbi:Tat pathway signal sequence domain protein [Mobiluncus mulieris ATCC 35239]|uniref:Tat pathway signal sequence domain protein n=2 Tax=Mobiluncus mulieris TaxID=2052 RepID=E0QQS4_9ACTO|nr:DUF6541 family protein [Mobiluncus mulieris]EFM45917.1 Tat pathway signal sequence domain protein [Mobiluncus mulieris ATCC 35239]MCU9970985.1 hypothetical protein [Mobiluncus mulieris]MCU9975262.1 hypothetical protein [Mobiluncus mulieris]MCU9993279.1 hypothetical protein [Mobiluncus mulieris]MCV0013662.1 hypothetical protein [Mobiluncus mulieris]